MNRNAHKYVLVIVLLGGRRRITHKLEIYDALVIYMHTWHTHWFTAIRWARAIALQRSCTIPWSVDVNESISARNTLPPCTYYNALDRKGYVLNGPWSISHCDALTEKKSGNNRTHSTRFNWRQKCLSQNAWSQMAQVIIEMNKFRRKINANWSRITECIEPKLAEEWNEWHLATHPCDWKLLIVTFFEWEVFCGIDFNWIAAFPCWNAL